MSLQPVTSFKDGAKIKIASLPDGAKVRGRLCALGVMPGSIVEVIESGPGPCRLRVRESMIVLGRGVAQRLMAESNGEE